MNSIKFEDNNDKNNLKKIYSNDKYYIIIDILKKISKKYHIKDLIIGDVYLDYDSVKMKIISKKYDFKKYSIDISLSAPYMIAVKSQKGNNIIIDKYILLYDALLIKSSTYSNRDNPMAFAKIYNSDIGYYSYSNKDAIYNVYEYQFKNKNLNAKITLEIDNKFAFIEYNFINNILSKSEINTIDDLCREINSILKGKAIRLNIINLLSDEQIQIINGNLQTYRKNIKNEQDNYFLNYENGSLRITYNNLDPETNEEIKKAKELVKIYK